MLEQSQGDEQHRRAEQQRLNAMLGGKLDNVLETLAEGLWPNAA